MQPEAYNDHERQRLLDEFFGSDIRERLEIESLPRILAGCDRFLDVGANIGQYMYHANRIIRNGEIVGVEANPRLIPLIRDVLARAGRESPNGNTFRIEHAAVSDREGTVDFFLTAAVTTSSLFETGSPVQRVAVPARPLDAFYRPSARTVIKMDVEGAEYRALASGSRFLRSDHCVFLLELHAWGDRDARRYPLDVCRLLRRHGYGVRKIGSHYLFERPAAGARVSGHGRVFFPLFCKQLVYRFAPRTVPFLCRARDRMRRTPS